MTSEHGTNEYEDLTEGNNTVIKEQGDEILRRGSKATVTMDITIPTHATEMEIQGYIVSHLQGKSYEGDTISEGKHHVMYGKAVTVDRCTVRKINE